jgi:hypothetical protein
MLQLQQVIQSIDTDQTVFKQSILLIGCDILTHETYVRVATVSADDGFVQARTLYCGNNELSTNEWQILTAYTIKIFYKNVYSMHYRLLTCQISVTCHGFSCRHPQLAV